MMLESARTLHTQAAKVKAHDMMQCFENAQSRVAEKVGRVGGGGAGGGGDAFRVEGFRVEGLGKVGIAGARVCTSRSTRRNWEGSMGGWEGHTIFGTCV